MCSVLSDNLEPKSHINCVGAEGVGFIALSWSSDMFIPYICNIWEFVHYKLVPRNQKAGS